MLTLNMNRLAAITLLLFTLCLFHESGKLVAQQLDPALMAKFSQLSAAEKADLIKAHGSGQKTNPNRKSPTAIAPTEALQVEVPKANSFNERGTFLSELQVMATSVRSDLDRMESELAASIASPDPELLQAIEETRSLLRKIKGLQRREIEKRAEEFSQDDLQAISHSVTIFSRDLPPLLLRVMKCPFLRITGSGPVTFLRFNFSDVLVIHFRL